MLFLSHYPDEDSVKDGMSQRIVNIDSFFKSDNRTYLNISLRRFPKVKTKTINQLTIIECNFFFHFFYISRIVRKADKVYIHSVLNVLNSLIFLLFVKKDIFLDLHGVVPEEAKMNNKQIHFLLYKFCEKIIFRRLKAAICVSENMKSFYQKEYPRSKVDYIIYPILPDTLVEGSDLSSLTTNVYKVNFIYAGNTQKWQNIELMIELISKNLIDNFEYYILTRDVSEMKSLFEKKFDLNIYNKIKILSVSPAELADYYKKCHYGFILRDDVLVNQVACPTKLVEYLHYGIIPIVLSPNIGDFKALDFDYVSHYQSFSDLVPKKSSKNIEIVNKLLERNKKLNIREIVLFS